MSTQIKSDIIPDEVDITPDPRILQILGDIPLEPWQCVAEFIDNSVDGFLSEIKIGSTKPVPTVSIGIAATKAPSAQRTTRRLSPLCPMSERRRAAFGSHQTQPSQRVNMRMNTSDTILVRSGMKPAKTKILGCGPIN